MLNRQFVSCGERDSNQRAATGCSRNDCHEWKLLRQYFAGAAEDHVHGGAGRKLHIRTLLQEEKCGDAAESEEARGVLGYRGGGEFRKIVGEFGGESSAAEFQR